MTQIAIVGATGRMGQQLIRACYENDHVNLVAAVDRPDSDMIGQDAGRFVGLPDLQVPISRDFPAAADYQVLIDFTHASATADLIRQSVERHRPLVIGTTGLDESVHEQIDDAAREIPVLMASNYSLGVNVTMKLLEVAAQAIGDIADIEVIEAHHRYKVDAPSGTALSMGDVLAEATGKTLPRDGVYARVGQMGEREQGSIGFSTIRGGDIVGEHTVYLAMDGERIEITHRAMDRMVFARGAVRAAHWLAARPPGRYDMNDVLALG